MTHTHQWKRDQTRKHGDHKRGRFFVQCECGAMAQATLNNGYLHIFNTNKFKGGSNVISIRVNDSEFKTYKANKEIFKKKAKTFLKVDPG